MSERNLTYYMSLPYRVLVYPEEDGSGYTAVVPELPGCMTCADTHEHLWPLLEEAKELWFEVALASGDYIPEPAPVEVETYSGKFLVRIPRSLHRQLAGRAEQESTSLNQLVVMLLSEEMGRWAERSRTVRSQYDPVRGVVKPFTRDGFQALRCSIAQEAAAFTSSQEVVRPPEDAWTRKPEIRRALGR
jgi:antitoxin HicB